jgi:lysozyme
MKTNQAGIDLIASFEGLRLKAYPDPGTGGDPWTIGYGHTKDVNKGDTCTQAQAEEWLREDLSDAEDAVNGLGIEMTENQFSALVSFTFNCGAGNLRKLMNQGIKAVPQRILKWDKAAGKVMLGLIRRRRAEQQLFLS